MKCPECEKAGEKSCVYPQGSSRTMLMGCEYYDEEGRYHQHDPNVTTTGYRCSNGHEWVEKHIAKCWCEEGKVIE